MGLRQECPYCGMNTIPKRIIGVYAGSADSIKIWECRECHCLWSSKQRPILKVGRESFSSA